MTDPAYETALIEYGTFMVAGYTAEVQPDSLRSRWWQRLYEQLGSGKEGQTRLQTVEKLQRVGVLMPDADDRATTYTAGFIVPGGIRDVAALGLTGVLVPAALYATVLVEGSVQPGTQPAQIGAGFDYLAETFLPSKHLHPTGVHLEVYGPGDTSSENYRMYLWTAVSVPPST